MTKLENSAPLIRRQRPARSTGEKHLQVLETVVARCCPRRDRRHRSAAHGASPTRFSVAGFAPGDPTLPGRWRRAKTSLGPTRKAESTAWSLSICILWLVFPAAFALCNLQQHHVSASARPLPSFKKIILHQLGRFVCSYPDSFVPIAHHVVQELCPCCPGKFPQWFATRRLPKSSSIPAADNNPDTIRKIFFDNVAEYD
jgi:hypothetical protein